MVTNVSLWTSSWHGGFTCFRRQLAHYQLQSSLLFRRYASSWDHRFSDEEDDIIAECRRQGQSYASIGHRLGRSASSVHGRYRERLQYISPKNPAVCSRSDPELASKVLKHRQEGMPFTEMSEVLGESSKKLRDIYNASEEGQQRTIPKGTLAQIQVCKMLRLRSEGQIWSIAQALGRTRNNVCGHYQRMLESQEITHIDREMKKLQGEGLDMLAIAERLAVPVHFVQKRLDTSAAKSGLVSTSATYKLWTKDDGKRLRSLWQAGTIKKEIAVTLGRTHASVVSAINNHYDDWGLERRQPRTSTQMSSRHSGREDILLCTSDDRPSKPPGP